jgi:hypothetical protein
MPGVRIGARQSKAKRKGFVKPYRAYQIALKRVYNIAVRTMYALRELVTGNEIPRIVAHRCIIEAA